MTYFPAGETTGVGQLEVAYGSGTSVGSGTFSLGTFTLVPNKHIAVRLWLKVRKPRVGDGLSGISDNTGYFGNTESTLYCPEWVNYVSVHHAYVMGSHIVNYNTAAPGWISDYVNTDTYAQCHPFAGTTVTIGVDAQLSYLGSGAVPSTTATVQAVGTFNQTKYYVWVALLYRKV